MFEEALDELAARVFRIALGRERVAREEGLGLDVDEQRGDVDELAGGVDVVLLEVVGVLKKLGGDAADGDVVDVDVLLADEVEEEVHGAVVDLADGDAEGGLRGLFGGLVFGRGTSGLGGRRGRGGVVRGRRARGWKWVGRYRLGQLRLGPSAACFALRSG